MPIQRVVQFLNNKYQEYVAKDVSAGVGDAGHLVALNSFGQIDNTMMPTGILAEVGTALASEALTAGNFVQVYNNAGVPNVRRADASTVGKQANAFVLSSFASGATATVYVAGINNAVTGQVAGPVFLGTTPGGVQTTAPTVAGQVAQQLGEAISATAISFQPQMPLSRA